MHSRYRVIVKNMIEWQMMFDEQFVTHPHDTGLSGLDDGREGTCVVSHEESNEACSDGMSRQRIPDSQQSLRRRLIDI